MLITSFTTIPSRLDNLSQVLESIHNQTKKADLIIVNCPSNILRLNKKNDVDSIKKIIMNCPAKEYIYLNITRDYGPITKIYPLINLDFVKQDDEIIVIDDDRYYASKLFESLTEEFIRFNKSEAVCMFGLNYPRKLNDRYLGPKMGNRCELMEATWGYIVKRSHLNDLKNWSVEADTYDKVIELNFENSFLSDDYVISRYLDSQNVYKRVISAEYNLNKKNCFEKRVLTSSNPLSSLEHNLDKYVKSEQELKLKRLV